MVNLLDEKFLENKMLIWVTVKIWELEKKLQENNKMGIWVMKKVLESIKLLRFCVFNNSKFWKKIRKINLNEGERQLTAPVF